MIFYAIKLNFEGDSNFYIHHDSGKCDGYLSPILFETKESADLYAKPWREKCSPGFVSVVEYEI
mgnify:CR=1 FL=1